MRHLEDDLRATVEDLAGSAPPLNGMAMVARIRGRRIRRRRRAVLAVAVAVLAGAVIAPYAVVSGHRAEPGPAPATAPPSAPAPSRVVTAPAIGKDWWKAPIALPGGLVVTSVGRRSTWDAEGNDVPAPETMQAGNVALDRATGRYRTYSSKYQQFVGAPTGPYVMVEDASAVGGYVPLGFVNAATGAGRLLNHGSGSGAVWSEDGTKVLLTLNSGGFRIIDAKTLAETDREIPSAGELCPSHCFFTWLPGGRKVAIAQRDETVSGSEGEPSTVESIAVYSVTTGKLLRTLPIPGVPAGTAAWSPDGRHVVVLPDATDETGLRIVEVATGRTVGVIRDLSAFDYPAVTAQVRFVGNDQIVTLNGLDVGLHDLTGTLRASTRLPADFADREVSLGVG
ncbi:hypothetical protein BJY16_001565 [Actinoplanes octamycinicus]|uniref:WD40 repeat protein n=1 Tax=Actinoplanes octamycinicus TaxID=135948 RepID=A0A7W7M5X0_9ACTN|nr:hypothetical protein [Actinoplanes octamycinicus]MBB4738106.1 hypothetical protein [Actinoplanes octamycinicus]GIE59339.1 hypothetical protein Aoc01nite_47410 [Actinoplanes octamycinicus]